MNNIASPDMPPSTMARILSVLAEPGSFARLAPHDKNQLAMFRRRKGVTLGAGIAPLVECTGLLAAGLVAWTRVGARQQLVISAAGLAARHHGIETSGLSSTSDGHECPLPAIDKRPPTSVAVNHCESPLVWLYRRKGKDGLPQITAIQFKAGERFRREMERAQMLPKTTTSWSTPVSYGSGGHAGGSVVISDSALTAKDGINRACKAVGPEFSGLLIDVCGFLKGLERVEAERGWPARSAKLLLRLGLDRLASHYGMTDRPPEQTRRTGLKVWRPATSRPTLLPVRPQ